MSDRATITTRVAEAWTQTDLSQTQFAEKLREEAAIYEEAPELGADPERDFH
jgi:ribosome-binding protein aMBF1 (putative translation factor)